MLVARDMHTSLPLPDMMDGGREGNKKREEDVTSFVTAQVRQKASAARGGSVYDRV